MQVRRLQNASKTIPVKTLCDHEMKPLMVTPFESYLSKPAAERLANLEKAYPPDPLLARLQARFLQLMRTVNVRRQITDGTPDDVLSFLVSLDSTSHTIVHTNRCLAWRSGASCGCPVRANASSLRTTVGRLQGIFRDLGLTEPWESAGTRRNPCISLSVRRFIKLNALEQREGNVDAKQAALFDESVFAEIMRAAQADWFIARAEASDTLTLRRAQEVFLYAVLWHTGLRLKDALRLIFQQVEPLSVNGICGIRIHINVTKAEQESQPYRSIDIFNDGSAFNITSLWAALRRAYFALGIPTSVGLVFDSVKEDSNGSFRQVEKTSSAEFQSRFTSTCKRLGLDSSLTLHSFHGSRAHRDAVAGIPMEDTCAFICWTPAMYRRYLSGRSALSSMARVSKTPKRMTAAGRRRSQIDSKWDGSSQEE